MFAQMNLGPQLLFINLIRLVINALSDLHQIKSNCLNIYFLILESSNLFFNKYVLLIFLFLSLNLVNYSINNYFQLLSQLLSQFHHHHLPRRIYFHIKYLSFYQLSKMRMNFLFHTQILLLNLIIYYYHLVLNQRLSFMKSLGRDRSLMNSYLNFPMLLFYQRMKIDSFAYLGVFQYPCLQL